MVAEFKVVRAFVPAGPLIGGRVAAVPQYSLPRMLYQPDCRVRLMLPNQIRFSTEAEDRVSNPLKRPMEVSACIRVREAQGSVGTT